MSDHEKMVLIGNLITAVASRERERCAKLCEDYAEDMKGRALTAAAARLLAERIRELK